LQIQLWSCKTTGGQYNPVELEPRYTRREGLFMATNPVPASELNLTTDTTPTEIIVNCTGKITSNTIQSLKATVKPLFSESKTVVLESVEAYQFERAAKGTFQYYEVGPVSG
jgi:hypothetical protein